MSEAAAVLLDRSLRLSEHETALEVGWLLAELERRFDYGLDELARRFDRSVSWVSRTLARYSRPGNGHRGISPRSGTAVCRRLFVASQSVTNLHQDSLRNEILSQKPLTWYRDISLAGLVETLADAQLFGIGEKVASGVTARVGIFEQAMTGHIPSEPAETHDKLLASAKQKRRWAPLVTGGVVLLDEIGDLAPSLHAKLLRVLNGERQYRIGKEGNDAYSFQYEGRTILATWRDLGPLPERLGYLQFHGPLHRGRICRLPAGHGKR
jgi:hypothetical protein